MGFEHGMEGVQEFAHDGDQGLHFEFALGQQMLIEGAQVRVVLDGHQSRHEKGMTQMFIAWFANTRLLMYRGSRGVLARIQSGVGHPLAGIEVGRQYAELPQQLHGAGFADPRDAIEELKALRQLRVLGDQLARLAVKRSMARSWARRLRAKSRRTTVGMVCGEPGRMLAILLRRLDLHQLPQAPRQGVQGQGRRAEGRFQA